MKKKLLLGLILFLIVGILIFFLKQSEWDRKSDFKIAVIGRDKMGIVSISSERKMINSLEIDGEVLMWIPRGLGWYRSDRIRKLLEQEGTKEKIVDEIFFYNLGFLPDKIIYVDNFGDWRKSVWLRIRMLGDDFIYKKEVNKEKMSDDNSLLNEIMARDFADSRLINDDLRLSVINTTKESQLANFITRKLEWFGFSVVSVDNSDMKIEGKCLILFGPKSEESLGFKKLDFLECEKRANSSFGENEVELYFGDKYTQMLKYSTYVGTF